MFTLVLVLSTPQVCFCRSLVEGGGGGGGVVKINKRKIVAPLFKYTFLLNGKLLSHMKVLDWVKFKTNILALNYSVCWKMYFLHGQTFT